MRTQTWLVREIGVVDSKTDTGKLKLETEGKGGYMSQIFLYVPLSELGDYRIGDRFEVGINPKLATLTVMQ